MLNQVISSQTLLAFSTYSKILHYDKEMSTQNHKDNESRDIQLIQHNLIPALHYSTVGQGMSGCVHMCVRVWGVCVCVLYLRAFLSFNQLHLLPFKKLPHEDKQPEVNTQTIHFAFYWRLNLSVIMTFLALTSLPAQKAALAWS